MVCTKARVSRCVWGLVAAAWPARKRPSDRKLVAAGLIIQDKIRNLPENVAGFPEWLEMDSAGTADPQNLGTYQGHGATLRLGATTACRGRIPGTEDGHPPRHAPHVEGALVEGTLLAACWEGHGQIA